MYQIVRREQYSDVTFRWDVFAPDVAQAAQPGQFIMLRLHEDGERIPLTIADYDRKRGTITLVIQALGKTTEYMLNAYREGDWFLDFAGPLGLQSEIEKFGHVVMVGGGLGVAPIFPQLRAFKEAGNRTTAIIGFRNADLMFWKDKFEPYCDELIVCTDDGSFGKKGFVTVALDELLQKEKPDLAVAIGPMVMMRACADITKPHDVKTIVSLNAVMVDGTGMCGSCRVSIDGKVKFACVDGPDFDAHQVAWDELMKRQDRFKQHEAKARDDYAHVCKIRKTLFDDGKRNFKKLKQVEPTANHMPEQEADRRNKNFEEVNLGFGWDAAMAEAERCIQCKKPTCIAGCPVGIDIPRFIRHMLVRDLPGALSVMYEANLFPSICGRVCPQESQCEIQCLLAKKMEPVAIGRLERFLGDFAPAPVIPKPEIDPDLGKVAIVGSGPAGLACAADVARMGAEVTVYEALHTVGGVLRYGIPSFRLPRTTITREVQQLKELGVRFETNKIIGRTFTIAQLLGDMGYSAVFVGTGAGVPVFLGLEGETAGQVYSANEFLTRVNLMGGDKFPYRDTPVSLGDKVVVLGAGNTAMDCLRTSKRLGAKDVHCVYRRTEAEAPARVEEIRHAKEEGIEFHWLHGPSKILTDDEGNITGLIAQVMKLGEPDDSGRRRPVPIEGEFKQFECNTIIYALGTKANPIISQTTPDLELNKWGNIVADDLTQATSMKGVFAGGDIVTGGATVILALGAGRRAAKGIGKWLKDKQWPPVLTKEEAGVPGISLEGARCPKCHKQLDEDGGSYICCAGEEITWRCTKCQKVYEGFAFPYGMCAACGGELVLADSASVDSMGARRAISHAFEIELGGMAYYSRGAKQAKDETLAELFTKLSDMEKEHLHTLMRRYHVEPPELPLEGLTPTQMAIYAGADLSEGAGGIELLELALRLEERARDFFASQAVKLEEGSEEWRLYRELEAEEWDHVAIIETEIDRFKAGKPGML
ncbi:MAG: NADPH-dependent glutamate synthase [Deltaproteobacteria bacterium]|jgi:homotetrameric NADPH-dependent glutamate synthase|nr:NADPH-dependent glutamate synthase [Deltaproteobacteria bacterium]MBW2530371.1 NADPH-dependent glutamate synthase [Deltaproteobacteria bacterium]